jgi:hypothetical protein
VALLKLLTELLGASARVSLVVATRAHPPLARRFFVHRVDGEVTTRATYSWGNETKMKPAIHICVLSVAMNAAACGGTDQTRQSSTSITDTARTGDTATAQTPATSENYRDAADLPATASTLPVVAVLGLVSLGAALAVRVARRL